MSLTNYALQYVSYPTQALAKSCKILPVLVGNLLGMKAPLSKARYFSALLVTLGILLFNFAKTKESGSDSVTGLLLLGLALVMDGVNSFCTVIFK